MTEKQLTNLRWLAMATYFITPWVMAEDFSRIFDVARMVRIALYALVGIGCLIRIVWVGAEWQMGDGRTTFQDFLKQLGVTAVIGGSLSAGVYMWGLYGTGNPNS
jgi:hypothetical protein